MATGNTLLILTPHDNTPPATVYATLDIITGADAIAESFPCLAFDGATTEYADFYCVMPSNYSDATGVDLKFTWANAATTNTCVLGAAFRRIVVNSSDLDTENFAYSTTNVTGALTPPTTVGFVVQNTLSVTKGANMNSVVAGDYFLLRIFRPSATDANDTNTSDLRLLAIEVKET